MKPAHSFRADFPILARRIGGQPLTYLDSAATTQKPRVVIEALSAFYERYNASEHGGVYSLAEEAAGLYERARATVAGFLNAPSPRCIVFTAGTTASLNLVAWGWARRRLKPGDEILTTEIEHHSNLLPWQMAARETGAVLRLARLAAHGSLDVEHLLSSINPRTRLVTITAASNVLGTSPPLAAIIQQAHAVGARVVVDAAQAVAHRMLDVQALGCDFLAFSGHKVYGPMGVGVLYGRLDSLGEVEPLERGGGMIERVEEQDATWREIPARLEAGTPNIAGAYGLAAAIDYFMPRRGEALALEARLTAHALERLRGISGLTLYGPCTAAERGPVLAFNLEGIHPHDAAEVLDGHGVALRAGHHCCQVLMRRLGVAGTLRASLAMYSTPEDVDQLTASLSTVRESLAP